MCIAWLFCAPVALLVARLRHFDYFKPWLTLTRFKGGRQYWYMLHRNLLMTAVLLTLGAGALMFGDVELHFQFAHSTFGVITMALGVFQVQPCLSDRSCSPSLTAERRGRP